MSRLFAVLRSGSKSAGAHRALEPRHAYKPSFEVDESEALRRLMTTRTNRFTKLTPTYLATAGPLSQTPASTSGASGSGAQAVADDVLHLLRRANHRAEVHVKQTQKAKRTNTRRAAKARRDAEALLSTDVLLDIANRRSDVGEDLCPHCSNSLQLSNVRLCRLLAGRSRKQAASTVPS